MRLDALPCDLDERAAEVEHDDLLEDARVDRAGEVLKIRRRAAAKVHPRAVDRGWHGLDHRDAAVQEAVAEGVVRRGLARVERFEARLVIPAADGVDKVVEEDVCVVAHRSARSVGRPRDNREARGQRREVRRVVHRDAVGVHGQGRRDVRGVVVEVLERRDVQVGRE